jgi:PAS domain S-box-containing protein
MDPSSRRDPREAFMVLDHLPVQVWLLDDADTYAWVNATFAAFHGRTPVEVEGLRLADLLPPEVAVEARRSNQRVVDTGQPLEAETWVEDHLGTRRLLAITKTPQRDDQGGVAKVVCVAVDVTEQRAAEARLSQSEENFRSLVETVEDLVVIADEEGRLEYANPATLRKLGHTAESIRGITLLDMHPPWVRAEAQAIVGEMFAGLRETCPLPLISRSGTLLPVETRVWFGTWNGTRSVFGLCRDLSREQETLQRFEKLFRKNPALMAISDVESGQFTDVNDTWLRVLGYTRDEVLGRGSGELDLFPMTDEKDRVTQLLQTYGRLEEVELGVKDQAGRLHTGLFSGEIVESQGKRFFLTLMVDITERRRAEEDRELVIQELKGALEQIKTLRGIVPICAKCKKIRDDRGFWQQVEAYITRHTAAQFSHGLCPGCAEELYDDLARNPDGSSVGGK